MLVWTRRNVLSALGAAGVAQSLRAATLQQVRLGVTTDEIDDDVVTALRFLRTNGLAYAEVRNIWGKYNTAQPPAKVREAKALFDEYQIKCSVLGTAFFKVPLPGESAEGGRALDEQWKLLDDAMERASIMGTDKIRVFAFMREGAEKPQALPRIYELVREAAKRARPRNFRLVLENVGGSYVSTGAEAAALLKAVKEPNLGLTWDPNNAGAAGEKPFPDGYRRLDPARIMHVHLRDFRKAANGKWEWCAVGEGEMDNLGQIRALLKDGYKESFTLETHYKSPLGKAHASQTSLEALKKTIAAV